MKEVKGGKRETDYSGRGVEGRETGDRRGKKKEFSLFFSLSFFLFHFSFFFLLFSVFSFQTGDKFERSFESFLFSLID